VENLIFERLVRIETVVGEIKDRLFGNGQEGELARVKTRLRTLERFRWLILGMVMLLVAVSGIAAALLNRR
jgi:hypothetical protein